jgi:hypothetical protein
MSDTISRVWIEDGAIVTQARGRFKVDGGVSYMQIRHNCQPSAHTGSTLSCGTGAARRAKTKGRTQGSDMRKLAFAILLFAAIPSLATAAERPIRFWNLTRHTISEFYLAPAGTTNWGQNQCKNDRDGTVDSDERLRITDTPPGLYDAKLVDVSKRTCIVRNLKLEAGEIFSIEEKDLTSCTQ